MTKVSSNYYVYVYIDPRSFEEFYYGKGKGNRKNAHLKDDGDSQKVKRIREIKKAGLEPIIKVIAKDLTEREAFLIEKTLIWKLGRTLDNISSGHFSDKFRAHQTFHLDLPGFDYQNGLFYVNVGEGHHRCWEDCMNYGFLAAGQSPKWSDQIRTLNPGDVVVAYLKGHGYVGIGRVKHKVVNVREFRVKGKSLKEFNLERPTIFENSDNENAEFLVKVEWIKSVPRKEAKWKSKSGLFTTQLVKAALHSQVKTLEFLEEGFGVRFENIVL